MNISELSIRRPVLATVLTIIILLFGLIGYNTLGVREYPSVDNPIISVTCSYSGANADVIENQITEPLEQNINGIPGIRSLSSVSQQGQCRITVEFELSVDLETAANDVRDKVSRAQRYLPRDCDPPTVSKADADAVPILMVAIQSDSRSLLELSEIADLTVKEQLQTISDVSSVSIWGEKRYSMRLWLDPTKMAGYGITPVDVKNAVTKENIELPSGSIEGNTVELTLRTMGQMHTAKEFNNIILKEVNGNVIRFSDIGYAELGPADIKSYMKMNGVPMVGVVVIPQPGANHIEIADAVYQRMQQMQKDLPEDVKYSYGFDNTKFIRASIDEVKTTVYEAFILVIIIIFLFLRDWRVTLIPCIVIPVSLIGAFFVMYIAGFSINVLTMLAVVLSVGLVVDDAIVMTENIYIRIDDAGGEHGPCRQREGPGHIGPCRFIGLPAAQRLSEGEAARDHESAVAEEQQRRMEDHAGVLEQGVQTVAILRHGVVHEERIVPRHEDEPEEAHDAEVEDPVPKPRIGGQAFIGAGELEQPAADGYGKSPEQHGAGLSCPEGRNAVEERQQPVGVARHIDQGEVIARQRIYKDSGRDDVAARQAQVGLFDKAEARNGGAAGGLARRRGRPWPQRFDGPCRSGECAEHGEREKDESEIIHGSSKLSGISSRESGANRNYGSCTYKKAAPPASYGARRARRQASRRFGAGRRSASVFLLIFGRALGHERFGLKRTVRPEPPFHNDFRTGLEGIRNGARVLDPQRGGLVFLILQPELDVTAGFGA